MVTLDKSKKLPFKTYFHIPPYTTTYLQGLFYVSHEKHYKIINASGQKPQQNSETNTINPGHKICISNYPEDYLSSMLEDYINDDERFEQVMKYSQALKEIRIKQDENIQ